MIFTKDGTRYRVGHGWFYQEVGAWWYPRQYLGATPLQARVRDVPFAILDGSKAFDEPLKVRRP